ncbi:MAG TPA: XRE family transcriptional regulator [Campylobacterales bacterium]|nr:XRE family transcriptional regulator [Campylobacterales bacterium]
MDYEEFTRNIRKAGLTLKEFALLIKTNPNSITNLSKKEQMPKNLAIIAVLLGEMVDKGIKYKHLFEQMDIEPQKARVKGSFGKSKK